MGLKFENFLSGFVVFSILVSLVFGIYTNIASEYTITPDYVDSEGRSVIVALNDINIISGFEDMKTAMTSLYERSDSTGSEYDILGTLKAAGIGTVKVVTGLVTAPLEIMMVIAGFYFIPPYIYMGIGLIIFIYVGVMILNEILGK